MILTACFSRATTAGRKTNAHPSPSTPCSCVPVRRLHKGKAFSVSWTLIYSIVFCRCSVCFGPLKLIVFYSLLLAIDLQPRPQIYRNGVAWWRFACWNPEEPLGQTTTGGVRQILEAHQQRPDALTWQRFDSQRHQAGEHLRRRQDLQNWRFWPDHRGGNRLQTRLWSTCRHSSVPPLWRMEWKMWARAAGVTFGAWDAPCNLVVLVMVSFKRFCAFFSNGYFALTVLLRMVFAITWGMRWWQANSFTMTRRTSIQRCLRWTGRRSRRRCKLHSMSWCRRPPGELHWKRSVPGCQS